MRLKIKLTKNESLIPINNQHLVNSYVHKCLGRNNKYHDSKSDYCISNLRGGKLNSDKQSLNFDNGSFIVVTSENSDFISSLLSGISTNQEFFCGMKVNGFEFISEEFSDGYNIFKTLTPILIKEKVEEHKYKFVTIKDSDYISKLKTSIINKLSKIDSTLDFTNFSIEINDRTTNKTKLILVKNVKNVASQCDIVIHSSKKIAEYIYNYGIGQSTGSGFGTVYNSKNHNLYYDKI